MREDIEQFFNATGAHIENEDYGGVYIGYTDKVYFKYLADCETEDEYYESCFKLMAFWAENKLDVADDKDIIADAATELLCDQFQVTKRKKVKYNHLIKAQALSIVDYLNKSGRHDEDVQFLSDCRFKSD